MADALHDFFGTTTAPDCSVECVGVHYTKSWRHKLELLAGARSMPITESAVVPLCKIRCTLALTMPC